MALRDASKKIAAEFDLSDLEIQRTVNEFITELRDGLTENASNLSQIPTYITVVPDGTEKGLYLSVDLGGTNFRVSSIQLNGENKFDLKQSKIAIPKDLKVARTGKGLFSFLAKQIEIFLKEHHEDRFTEYSRRHQSFTASDGYRNERVFYLGFTFSFPVNQSCMNRGTLIRWTKGFDIPEVVGQDVCTLLQHEIDLLGLPVKVAALVNDTVGTLLARSYTSPTKKKTLLGAIFGTGTNGAYLENIYEIRKPLAGDFNPSTGKMVMNVEWGSFDNNLKVLPNTTYDIILDKGSINSGFQMFEKRVSGMFLGELLRIVLESLSEDSSIRLFRDKYSSLNDIRSSTTIDTRLPLYKKWAIDSSILSIAKADKSVGLCELRHQIRCTFDILPPSIEEAQAVRVISNAIAKRAAKLAGVAIAAILVHTRSLSQSNCITSISSRTKLTTYIKMYNLALFVLVILGKIAQMIGFGSNKEDFVDIGVSGSLIEFYPGFEDYMREVFQAVDHVGVSGDEKIQFGITKEGSSVGGALMAFVAAQMENKR
ncbi:Glucokinase [Erysiphe neolycopersici]|uniref:Phosphotransferase n=1 Tax=Erysiphe neolycopersici TaxID=212602 RepID=A0A420HS75_9PEZI|nr:Glucokinase [Erysiphe neolycopersici]